MANAVPQVAAAASDDGLHRPLPAPSRLLSTGGLLVHCSRSTPTTPSVRCTSHGFVLFVLAIVCCILWLVVEALAVGSRLCEVDDAGVCGVHKPAAAQGDTQAVFTKAGLDRLKAVWHARRVCPDNLAQTNSARSGTRVEVWKARNHSRPGGCQQQVTHCTAACLHPCHPAANMCIPLLLTQQAACLHMPAAAAAEPATHALFTICATSCCACCSGCSVAAWRAARSARRALSARA